MKRFLILLITFFILFSSVGQAALKKGAPAPDFEITGTDGNNYSLHKLKGKVILVEFFSTKCFACDLVIPDINRLNEKFNNKQVVVIGVLFNDEISNVSKLAEFSKERGIKYPIYFADSKFKKLYNIFGFPNFIILNERKEVIQIYRGVTKDMFGFLSKEIEKALK